MKVLRELLVCPACRSSLSWSSDIIVCGSCRRTFALESGAPNLTPNPPPDNEVAERWPLWEVLQANGDRAYRVDPVASLSVGAREDALAFGRFCALTGVVLDVGCGPQSYPSYATGFEGLLVGIDLLRGTTQRNFSFVQGVGEYLPFPDSTFDRVLFATSLDHMLVPQLALREAHRVVRPGGRVVVWMGVADPPEASLPQRIAIGLRLLGSGQWREFVVRLRATTRRRSGHEGPAGALDPLGLETPAGAVDPFHVSQPPPERVIADLEAAGLEVDRQQRPTVYQCWISAKPSRGSKPLNDRAVSARAAAQPAAVEEGL